MASARTVRPQDPRPRPKFSPLLGAQFSMFKPLTLFIGLRYTRAKRRTGFISFITLTSVMGIALGVAALITVLSVMNGFEAELRERILGMTSHASITGADGELRNWEKIEPVLQNEPRIRGWAPYVEGQAMINSDRRVSGTMIRGIHPDLSLIHI